MSPRDSLAKASPFKFLDYYTEPDAHIFGGRDDDTRNVVAQLSKAPTLVLYGQSGTGKTSLVLAGVFPHLRKTGWLPVYVRILRDPIRDTLAAITTAFDDKGGEGGETLKTALGRLTESHKAVVLVFDQFEEFFIRFTKDGSRTHFFEEIREAIKEFSPSLKVVFSLREDYIANLEDFSAVLPDLLSNRYRVQALTAYGVRQSVMRPLNVSGIDFDYRLISRIVDYLHEFSYDPVMLQILCTQLVRKAGERDPDELNIKVRDLEELGGIEGVFRSYLSETVSSLDDANQLLCRVVLASLITRDETKQAMRLNDLQQGQFVADEANLGHVLATLVDQRLVRREHREDDIWYELSHERLAKVVLDWIRLDRAFYEFTATRDLIKTASSNDVWRGTPEALLTPGQLDGLVRPNQELLRLTEEETEFLLCSAIFRQGAIMPYWANRYGTDKTFALLRDTLLIADDDAMRASAAVAVGVIGSGETDLLEICARMALEDKSSSVRRAAGRVLTGGGDSWARDALTRGLQSPETKKPALEAIADRVAAKVSLKGFSTAVRRKARRIHSDRVLNRQGTRSSQWLARGTTMAVLGSIAWGFSVNLLLLYLGVVLVEFGGSPDILFAGTIVITIGLLVALLFGGWTSTMLIRRTLAFGAVSWAQAVWRSMPYKLIIFFIAGLFPLILLIDWLDDKDLDAWEEGEFWVGLVLPLVFWAIMPLSLAVAQMGMAATRGLWRTLLQSQLAALGLPTVGMAAFFYVFFWIFYQAPWEIFSVLGGWLGIRISEADEEFFLFLIAVFLMLWSLLTGALSFSFARNIAQEREGLEIAANPGSGEDEAMSANLRENLTALCLPPGRRVGQRFVFYGFSVAFVAIFIGVFGIESVPWFASKIPLEPGKIAIEGRIATGPFAADYVALGVPEPFVMIEYSQDPLEHSNLRAKIGSHRGAATLDNSQYIVGGGRRLIKFYKRRWERGFGPMDYGGTVTVISLLEPGAGFAAALQSGEPQYLLLGLKEDQFGRLNYKGLSVRELLGDDLARSAAAASVEDFSVELVALVERHQLAGRSNHAIHTIREGSKKELEGEATRAVSGALYYRGSGVAGFGDRTRNPRPVLSYEGDDWIAFGGYFNPLEEKEKFQVERYLVVELTLP